MKSRSLLQRATWGLLLGTAVVVGLAAGGVWFAYRHWLWHGLENEMLQQAQLLRPLAQHLAEGRDVSGRGPRLPPYLILVVVRLEDGRRWQLGGEDDDQAWAQHLTLPPPGRETRVVRHPGWLLTSAPLRVAAPGERNRREALLGDERSGPAAYQRYLIRDVSREEHEITRLGIAVGGLWVSALVLALAGVRWLGRALVQPVLRFAQTIERLPPTGQRVYPAVIPKEMQPLAERLNGLLDRLEHTMERERALNAALAHELRTPLAGLRAQLELGLLREREAASYQQVLQTAQGAALRLQAIVDTLLRLARLESGQEQAMRQSVEITSLLRACFAAPQDDTRSLPASYTLSSDGDLLRVVCENIAHNALEHASLPGVRVTMQEQAQRLLILFSNALAQRPAEDLEHVFEPFWRGDVARSGNHAGLGLAIVRRILLALGGEARARWTAGVFTLEISLPLYEGA